MDFGILVVFWASGTAAELNVLNDLNGEGCVVLVEKGCCEGEEEEEIIRESKDGAHAAAAAMR